MRVKITVKNLDKVAKLFDNLKTNIKPEVIDKSLDNVLNKDLVELKNKLLNIVNNDLRSKVIIQEQEGKPEQILMKKSDQEITKHLTGVDLEKVSKTRDFTTLADGNLAIVSNKTLQKANIDRMTANPTSKMSSGVNLRLPMSEFDSFENQYAKALNYYNNALIMIVDNNGNTDYYLNPGIDLSEHVKVVCSKETGDTSYSRERWYKHRDKRGFADWTLTAEGVERVKRSFIKYNDVINKVKEGDFAEAINIHTAKSTKTIYNNSARKIDNDITQRIDTDKTQKIDDITQKIQDLDEKTAADPSVQAYSNLVKLIKNLRINKEKKQDRVVYTLVSVYDETVEDYSKFSEQLQRDVKMWKISNEKKWVNIILIHIVRLVNKLTR